MTIVDIYCRVSTDLQEENTSLGEQENAGRQFCKENGLVVGHVWREVFSGYVYREREALNAMRERYRSGKIQGVVIRTLDRLSRSQVHNAILMEEMEHHKAVLYCVKENIDETPMGKFIRMVLAFVAEMEREKILDRVTTGRVNKAKQGKIVSGSQAPYGWKWEYLNPSTECRDKRVVLNTDMILDRDGNETGETQVSVRQWLVEQYANGVSACGLGNQLNQRRIPSPDGGLWSDATVVRLVSDRRMTGKGLQIFVHQNRKTQRPLAPVDLPDGTYPAIVSEELFERVRMRRETNRAEAARIGRQPEEYLLRAGFVRCGHCNKPMGAVKHRKSFTYRCTRPGRVGHTNTILSKPLDAQIWQWVGQLADHLSLIEKAVELATSSDKVQEDAKAIERSIAIWRAKAQNYLGDLEDGGLVGDSRTAIRDALNNANKIVMMLEQEKEQVAAGLIDKEREQQAYRDILQWCQKVRESREELTYQQKRDFLRLLGVVVIVKNVKPYYENTIYRVEITLPAIQELLSPCTPAHCDTSSHEGAAGYSYDSSGGKAAQRGTSGKREQMVY